MRRLLAVLVLLLVSAAVRAEPPIPAQGWLVDQVGLLSPGDKSVVEDALRTLRQSEKGTEMAILIIDTVPDGDIEGYALAVGRAWKLGRPDRNDGLLLVHAVKDRRYRLEVGPGLQGALPDAAAGDIGRDILAAGFRLNDFRGAYVGAISAIAARLGVAQIAAPTLRQMAPPAKEEPADAPTSTATQESIPTSFWVFLGIVLALGIACRKNFWLAATTPAPITWLGLPILAAVPEGDLNYYAAWAIPLTLVVALIARFPLEFLEFALNVLFRTSGGSSSGSSSSSGSGGSFDGGGASGKY